VSRISYTINYSWNVVCFTIIIITSFRSWRLCLFDGEVLVGLWWYVVIFFPFGDLVAYLRFYPEEVVLLLTSFILPSAVPILFFSFPGFLSLPLFLVPRESPFPVILLHLVVYLMYGQSNTILFPLFCCAVGFFLSFP